MADKFTAEDRRALEELRDHFLRMCRTGVVALPTAEKACALRRLLAPGGPLDGAEVNHDLRKRIHDELYAASYDPEIVQIYTDERRQVNVYRAVSTVLRILGEDGVESDPEREAFEAFEAWWHDEWPWRPVSQARDADFKAFCGGLRAAREGGK